METSLPAASIQPLIARLRAANTAFLKSYPGEPGTRQPVHTVYGGAHLFQADTCRKLGEVAQRVMREYAPDFAAFAKAFGLAGSESLPDAGARESDPVAGMARTIHSRVIEKLQREPVEDFRIDFEDGYGNRPDAEEDGHAEGAAQEVARGKSAGTLPPFIGIRIKPFNEDLRERSVRTLDVFVTTLVRACGGTLPANFVVTLPKVTIPEQVATLADLFDRLEPALRLPSGSLRLEIMIETPQSIVGASDRVPLPGLLAAARGRCTAAHFGTYDYTAGCNITAAYQTMTHPACDFARHAMQVAYAGTGIMLSDGATNVMPVPVHRAASGGPPLNDRQIQENRSAVHRAWRLHADHIRHSLLHGWYQGWDLHPAQLPTRYATVYAFFLESLPAATERLKNFIAKAAQATLVGDVFDDAATGQGLLNYFLRGINCGALPEEAALATGVTLEELRGRSFLKILKNRRRS